VTDAQPESPPQNPAAAPANPSPPSGDPFYGKSREEVIRMYEDANARAEKIESGYEDLKEFVNRVGMFFKVDEKQGTVDLREDIVRNWAVARGIIPQPDSQNDTGNNVPQTQQNGMTGNNTPQNESLFDDEQRSYMQKLVQDSIKEALGQTVFPQLETARNERLQSWIQQMGSKYSDFPKWQKKVAEYVTRRNFPVNSMQDLEEAYTATKAIGGGFVDKSQHEAHVGDLMKTLQMLQPGAGNPLSERDPREMTNAELLGLDRQDEKTVAANRELFGKDFLSTE
jgi:hypothetical protein